MCEDTCTHNRNKFDVHNWTALANHYGFGTRTPFKPDAATCERVSCTLRTCRSWCQTRIIIGPKVRLTGADSATVPQFGLGFQVVRVADLYHGEFRCVDYPVTLRLFVPDTTISAVFIPWRYGEQQRANQYVEVGRGREVPWFTDTTQCSLPTWSPIVEWDGCPRVSIGPLFRMYTRLSSLCTSKPTEGWSESRADVPSIHCARLTCVCVWSTGGSVLADLVKAAASLTRTVPTPSDFVRLAHYLVQRT